MNFNYFYAINYIFIFIVGVFRGEIGVLGYANMNRCYVCGQTVPPNLVIGAPSTPLCPTTQVVRQFLIQNLL